MRLEFPQTTEDCFNLVCQYMGEKAWITVNSKPKPQRLFTTIHHEHKRMATIGWILKVEISK